MLAIALGSVRGGAKRFSSGDGVQMKKPRPAVAELVARFARIAKLDMNRAIGEDAVGMLVRLKDETGALDETECVIVELKRDGRISARRLVELLRRHQRECLHRR
ncbi:hypothetical protein LY44_03110 [Rhodobacter capsulatus]|uniref:Uncharacterized protein n=2 Tax=Rhodobacter capsulatus TaxID=1061 RepID=A0A1G7RD66_RHOCA|nr:hypothetical protein LY44_03110 [Rhodobacter capsulatus]SDG08672.1 hypothetical protein SAMN04244550_03397 [Rhodobacter capsulatus]